RSLNGARVLVARMCRRVAMLIERVRRTADRREADEAVEPPPERLPQSRHATNFSEPFAREPYQLRNSSHRTQVCLQLATTAATFAVVARQPRHCLQCGPSGNVHCGDCTVEPDRLFA